MAIHRVPILGIGTLSSGSPDVFFQPYSVLSTNKFCNRLICRFGLSNVAQPTVPHGLLGSFTIPKNYIGSAAIVYVWTATITSGDVCWQFYYNNVRGDNIAIVNPSSWVEGVTLVDTAPGAAHRRLEVSTPLTSSNFVPDDDVLFYIYRLADHAFDTMAGSALLFNALFQYSDV